MAETEAAATVAAPQEAPAQGAAGGSSIIDRTVFVESLRMSVEKLAQRIKPLYAEKHGDDVIVALVRRRDGYEITFSTEAAAQECIDNGFLIESRQYDAVGSSNADVLVNLNPVPAYVDDAALLKKLTDLGCLDSRNQNAKQKHSQEEVNENKNDKEDQVSPQTPTSQEIQSSATTPTKRPKNKDFKSPKNPMTKYAKRPLNANPASASNCAPVFDEAVNLMRSIQSRRVHNKEEYSLYGEQVAIKIRRLASPRARFVVQNIINNALFEAEMGLYDDDNAHARPQSQNTGLCGIPPLLSNMQSSFFPMTYQPPTGIPTCANVPVSTLSPANSQSTSVIDLL